jgi:glycosyltransferase involved in cell wall biosynthesis
VSTIEPRKNVTGLLNAFHYLRERYNTTETGLVLAGSEGWLYEETLETVRRLNLEQSTFFLGRVPDEDLRKLYVGARCHIHPAHYEGFGLPPLEAMACGTPTIVSNSSSLPEVVGDAALLVNPNDPEEIAVALHRLLSDDDLHQEMRTKGFQRANCFSWEAAARSTLEVYRKVAQSSAVRTPHLTPTSSKQTTQP